MNDVGEATTIFRQLDTDRRIITQVVQIEVEGGNLFITTVKEAPDNGKVLLMATSALKVV